MGSHRAQVRPRYGRLAALVAAVAVTVVSLVGGVGLLPSTAGTQHRPPVQQALDPAALTDRGTTQEPSSPTSPTSPTSQDTPVQSKPAGRASGQVDARRGDETALPADSGTGRRIVFSESAQRVWLVDADGTVRRTYLVSGSLTDNLDPGSYQVYSKSRWAVGVDDSGVMQYYVRFAHGDRSTIGFHTIPTHLGEPLQSVKDLGTPQSHGCIRQRTADAIALWSFAPVGTHVVVV
jgi:lipoprotein-anchoring transpeptidase ErfK/SrfK